MNNVQILLKNNFINIDETTTQQVDVTNLSVNVVTIVNNFNYYGYMPSMDVIEEMQKLNEKDLINFWVQTEKYLQELTGVDKEMEKFVVYKNFPKEVLDKSEIEYWTAQILMYWGIPSKFFAETEEKRPKLKENNSLKVLHLAYEDTLATIYMNLVKMPNRWTEEQEMIAKHLYTQSIDKTIDVSKGGFKENLINLAVHAMNQYPESYSQYIKIKDATDVLRLSVAISEGDINFKTPVQFTNFKRSERRFLLNLLNESNNLMDDVALRPEVFKRLLKNLHPGDYNFENVNNVYDKLYKKDYATFNSKVQKNIEEKDLQALELLKQRPGEMLRKMHHLYSVYKKDAINTFVEIMPSLNNLQLLKIEKYITTINDRKTLLFAPKGNWTAVQLADNKKVPFEQNDKDILLNEINRIVGSRLANKIVDGVDLDLKTKEVKLQTNDQELTSYGRGTSFDIPADKKFIRTASYWSSNENTTMFFDNSWNFFDENWKDLGVCCWNSVRINNAAIFSGDPINSANLKNAGCQMVDLYLDELEKMNVKYAVWNILSYNRIPFEKEDVLATLQYGDDAESGQLYEPSRAQMVFPLKGKNLTKYVAFIDVPNRKLVYMDANLYGNVHSATDNSATLTKNMPAYLEYLDTLPSLYDLFKHAPKGNTPILYSDANTEINQESAYVFKKENASNTFKDLSIGDLLNLNNEGLQSEKKKRMKKN